MLNVARPNLILKQCEGIPGYPIFLGEFEYEPTFKFNITFDTAFYQFPGKSSSIILWNVLSTKSLRKATVYKLWTISVDVRKVWF